MSAAATPPPTRVPPPASPTTDPPVSPPPTSNPPPPNSDPPSTSTPPPSTEPPPSTSSTPFPSTSSQPPVSLPPDSSTSAPQATLSLTNSSSLIPSTSVTNSVLVSTTNGQAFTTTVQVTSIFSAPAAITAAPNTTNNQGGGSNHTGAIVGGVVGGVVGGLAIVALLVWIILRKRRQAKLDEFDGNFDPARVVSTSGRGRLNLDDEDTPAAAGITPYPYPERSQQDMSQVPFGPGYVPSSSSASSPPQLPLPSGASSPSSNLYSPYNQLYGQTSPASDGGYTSSSGLPYASPTASSGGMMNAGTAAALLGRGGPSPGPSVNLPPSEIGSSGSQSGHGHSGSGGNGYYNNFGAAGRMSNKEREAYEAAGSSGRMVIANNTEQTHPQYQPYPTHSSSAAATPRAGTPQQQQQRGEKSEVNLNRGTSQGVIVHQDGGRVPQPGEEEPEREIPPTYDSIRRDQR